MERAVKELNLAKIPIVIVAELDRAPLEGKDIFFVRGDPARDESLLKANIHQARTALIAPIDDKDALLHLIAVKNLRRDLPTICMVDDGGIAKALRRAGAGGGIGYQ